MQPGFLMPLLQQQVRNRGGVFVPQAAYINDSTPDYFTGASGVLPSSYDIITVVAFVKINTAAQLNSIIFNDGVGGSRFFDLQFTNATHIAFSGRNVDNDAVFFDAPFVSGLVTDNTHYAIFCSADCSTASPVASMFVWDITNDTQKLSQDGGAFSILTQDTVKTIGGYRMNYAGSTGQFDGRQGMIWVGTGEYHDFTSATERGYWADTANKHMPKDIGTDGDMARGGPTGAPEIFFDWSSGAESALTTTGSPTYGDLV